MAQNFGFDEKNTLLDKTSPALKARLLPILGVDLLSELVSSGCLQSGDKEEILAIPGPAARYQAFFAHLRSHPVKNFQIFCRVLSEKFNRGDIITQVFELPDFSDGNTSAEPAPSPPVMNHTPIEQRPQTTDIGRKLRELFRKKLAYLTAKLDYAPIRKYLISHDIFIDETTELIDSKPTNSLKLEHLLDALQKRPDEAYVKLAWALQDSDQTHHLVAIGVTEDELRQIHDAYSEGQ